MFLKTLPESLSFQLRRVMFDMKQLQAVKVNDAFEFPKRLYVDRYLEQNKDLSLSLLAKQKALEQKLAALQKQRDGVLNYQGSTDLISACGALSVFLSDSSPVPVPEGCVSFLDNVKASLESQVKALDEQIAAIESEISALFSDASLQQHAYHLFAVLVHEGSSPNQGHYWTFIRDVAKDAWHKYNDAQVEEVSEENVMKESVGGHLHASAYYLMYVSDSQIKNLNADFDSLIPSLIPADVSAEVVADNAAFEEEILKYDEKQFEKRAGVAAGQILADFKGMFEEVSSSISTYDKAVVIPSTDVKSVAPGHLYALARVCSVVVCCIYIDIVQLSVVSFGIEFYHRAHFLNLILSLPRFPYLSFHLYPPPFIST